MIYAFFHCGVLIISISIFSTMQQSHKIANLIPGRISHYCMVLLTSQTGIGSDYSLPAKRESLYLDRETPMEHSGYSIYSQEHGGLSGIRSSGLGRAGAPIVTQVGIILVKLLFIH